MVEEQRPWGAETFRRELHDTLLQDIEALLDFLHDGLPATDAHEDRHLRPVIRHAVTLLLRGLLGESDNLDGSRWHRVGAGLAPYAGTRAVLMDRFDTGTRRVWAYLLRRTVAMSAPPGVSGGVLLDTWHRLESLRQSASQKLLAGYDERRLRERGGVTHPHEELVDSVLDRAYDDSNEMVLSAKRIGVDLTVPHGLFLVTTTPSREADVPGAARALQTAITGCVVGSPRSQPATHIAVLVACPSQGAWSAALRRAKTILEKFAVTLLTVGPVEPIGADRTFERSYRLLLRHALVAGAASSRPAILDRADVEYHWLLTRASVEERADLVKATLGPVLETTKGGELLDLLDALYETREGYTGAARLLDIHRNTVDTRRKKLTELTGLSLDVAADAHRLFTASRLLKLLDRATLGLPRS